MTHGARMVKPVVGFVSESPFLCSQLQINLFIGDRLGCWIPTGSGFFVKFLFMYFRCTAGN